MRVLLASLLLFQLSAWAKGPSINYSHEEKTVKIQHEQCLYGRGVQSELKQASFNQLNRYIMQKEQAILAVWQETYNLTAKQRDYLGLLLKLRLTPDDLSHEFHLSGNDTCTKANVQLTVDPNFDYALLFDLSPPDSLHFTASEQTAMATVETRLTMLDIEVRPELISKHLKQHAHFAQAEEQKAYFSFALKPYLTDVQGTTNTVYIQGDANFKRVMTGYLASKNFDVVSEPKAAFWHIELTGHIEEQKFINLSLTINNRDEQQFILTNNSRALPGADMTQSAMFEKFVQVHLELMKLTTRLQ